MYHSWAQTHNSLTHSSTYWRLAFKEFTELGITVLEESTRPLEPKKESGRVPWLSSLWALGRVMWDHLKATQRLFLCVHKVLDFPIELL